MKNSKITSVTIFCSSFLMLLTAVSSNLRADEADQTPESATTALLEEVVVTARKREESAIDVPISIAAFGSQQLETLKIRDLQDLTVGMPNVAMDDIGTTPATANFSIRGLGINSSIPSIDPTVGVFVDGVYIGQNTGVVIDMFDIQSIEVLRGPQGTLFGRNVTGGAVLINTKRPTDELSYSVRAAVDGNPNGDGGLNAYAMASVSGPLSDQFSARLSVYRNDDNGWFTNLADGKNFGKKDTKIIRPVLSWHPTESLRMFLRWEHLESDGDGPASQNHTNGSGVPGFFANYDRNSFDFAIDDGGFYDLEKDLVSWETNLDVGIGDGTVTNIFGWRKYTSTGDSDIDAQPVWLFHALFWSDAEQYSDELRFNGTFGKANVTTGVFWFTNEVNYHERRNLLGIATGGVAPALTQNGGGDYYVDSLAGFAAVDFSVDDNWTVNAGVRFTHEKKKAKIASLIFNVNSPCNVVKGTCVFDFIDHKSWDAWSGKLGVTYSLVDDRLLYANWSRSQRSGGYNLRNTAVDTVNLGPGPFDEETVDNLEFGFKADLGDRARLNAAVFYNQIDNMQREINLADPVSGVVQVIKNTADAEITGFEADGTFALGGNTLLLASLGWIDPSYKKVRFDLNGDGVLDQADKRLQLPRAAKWTYSVGLTHEFSLGGRGSLLARANYAFRDKSYYTDNNQGYLLSQEILDAGLDYRTGNGHWVISLYGRNLLNEVSHGGDTQLPNLLGPLPAGGTFSPLKKGRVAGVEVTFSN